jgi:DNA polymerase I
MKTLYVVDASGFLYRSYFAIRNMTNAKGESTNALYGFIRSIQKLIKDFKPEYLVSVFDGPQNIAKREAIYAHYKAHRASMPEDLRYQIDWAHQFCDLMGIPQLNVTGHEADDVMGSVAKWVAKQGQLAYLCTSDKDLCQLVNDHILILNTHKDNQIINAKEVEKIHGVSPQKMVDLLAMMGDSSDNIPGLSGFGPKTAAELLQSLGSLDYILDHPQEVPGKKKQETIVAERDKALLSRSLVTIDTDVEIPHHWEFFQLRPLSKDKIKTFYGQMNFNSLLRELDQMEGEEKVAGGEEYQLIDDEKAFQNLLEYLATQKEICFDSETTDLQPLRAELVGLGFAVEPKKAWYVPVNGHLGLERVLKGVKPLFENSKIGFYGHNVKYDVHVLANYGIEVANLSFDTILASYLLNSHQRQHSLDTLSLEYFGKVKIPISDLIGKGKKQISMREVPIERVCTYCCEDVDYTCRLKQVLAEQLAVRGLDKLFFSLELPLLPILAGMERHGIYLDVPILHRFSKEIVIQIKELAEQIYKMAGTEFNLNSPAQLLKILFERLKIPYPKKRASSLSTGEEILELLKNEYPIAGKMLEYRKLEKLRSTYVDSLPHDINPKTHRIHCTFNQSVAATGRLSCQDPNLQNIPVRSENGRRIREAFRPEKEGWSYLSADYSQVELRLLAHLSEDPKLLEAFHHNHDIHASTAAAIYHIPLKEVTKDQRQSAKAVNFGIVYGQQAFGLAQELNISTSEAAAFIDTYFKQFKRVREFLESCKEQARKTGRAVTYTGRERLIPEIHSKNSQLRSQAERLAVNTPFQGTAADLIKMAMLEIDKQLKEKKLKSFMILQIHDELIFELPDEELTLMKPLVKKAMEHVLTLKIPLIVDISVGKNWKEC